MHKQLYNLDPLLQSPIGDDNQIAFVDNFFRLIDECIEPPYAISLDGMWGTGKTTIMKLLQFRLIEKDYPSFWFNPWEYRSADSIVLAFLQCLAATYGDLVSLVGSKGKTFLHVLLESGMDVGLQLLSKGNMSLSGVKKSFEAAENEQLQLHESYRNTVESIKKEFLTLTNSISEKHNGKPLVIFIDDLDRCLPEDAIHILEALKNLFVTIGGKTIFICGLDTRIAKQFISYHYQGIEENFSINYFRKIFNLTISMPYSLNINRILTDKIDEIYQGHQPINAAKLAEKIFLLGLETKTYSIRKYLNIITNYFIFLRFNPHYDLSNKNDFIICLFVLKEVWQPLFEEMIKEALRKKADTGDIVEGILKDDQQKPPLTSEQRNFLQHNLGKDSPSSDHNLCILIADYPTIA